VLLRLKRKFLHSSNESIVGYSSVDGLELEHLGVLSPYQRKLVNLNLNGLDEFYHFKLCGGSDKLNSHALQSPVLAALEFDLLDANMARNKLARIGVNLDVEVRSESEDITEILYQYHNFCQARDNFYSLVGKPLQSFLMLEQIGPRTLQRLLVPNSEIIRNQNVEDSDPCPGLSSIPPCSNEVEMSVENPFGIETSGGRAQFEEIELASLDHLNK